MEKQRSSVERQKPECIDRQWDEAGAGVLRDGHQVSWPVKKPSLARQSVFILQTIQSEEILLPCLERPL